MRKMRGAQGAILIMVLFLLAGCTKKSQEAIATESSPRVIVIETESTTEETESLTEPETEETEEESRTDILF